MCARADLVSSRITVNNRELIIFGEMRLTCDKLPEMKLFLLKDKTTIDLHTFLKEPREFI